MCGSNRKSTTTHETNYSAIDQGFRAKQLQNNLWCSLVVCYHLVRLPKVVHYSSHVFVLLGEQSRHEPATALRVVHRDVGVDVVHGQASVDRNLKGVPERTNRAGSRFRCYLQIILGTSTHHKAHDKLECPRSTLL